VVVVVVVAGGAVVLVVRADGRVLDGLCGEPAGVELQADRARPTVAATRMVPAGPRLAQRRRMAQRCHTSAAGGTPAPQ
jgi:hypothetical protein